MKPTLGSGQAGRIAGKELSHVLIEFLDRCAKANLFQAGDLGVAKLIGDSGWGHRGPGAWSAMQVPAIASFVRYDQSAARTEPVWIAIALSDTGQCVGHGRIGQSQ
ncbi:hypothetical protein H681_11930 [Pseudomonas sp. ATCC 13867]|nr:hypothetical protein H681_11930 [Pseudomonas sp. ATCC 13867]